MKKVTFAGVLLLVVGSLLSGLAPACGGSTRAGGGSNGADGASGSSGSSSGSNSSGASSSGVSSGGASSSGSVADGGLCSGLQCQISRACGTSVNGGHNTSISGSVYDPAGRAPLYDVVVYVPNSPVDPLPVAPAGTCSCASLFSGNPIAAGVTDATGHFVIPNAPDNDLDPSAPIPLVIQIGKWRRQTSIATVKECTDNSGGTQKLTLPSQADAKDDLPQIAVSTGGTDSLECLLLRVGLSPTEYTRGAGGTGHVHIFQGSSPLAALAGARNAAAMAPDGGPTPSALSNLFDSANDLAPYDVVLLGCEGGETTGVAGITDGGASGLTPGQLAAMQTYTSAGGRAFFSHQHYPWLTAGPFAAASPPLATWAIGPNPIYEGPGGVAGFQNYTYGAIVTDLLDGGVFQKGLAFKTWLQSAGALTDAGLYVDTTHYNPEVGAATTGSQSWIRADQSAVVQFLDGGTADVPGAVQYFTFDTPLGSIGTDDAGSPEYCGRIAYSEVHTASSAQDYNTPAQQPIVPDQCNVDATGLFPQDKALEFMLFDLVSCVTPDTGPGSAGGLPFALP